MFLKNPNGKPSLKYLLQFGTTDLQMPSQIFICIFYIFSYILHILHILVQNVFLCKFCK